MYYYANNENQAKGPHSLDEITKLIADQKVTANSLVWCVGAENWKMAKETVELQDLFKLVPPPLPVPPPIPSIKSVGGLQGANFPASQDFKPSNNLRFTIEPRYTDVRSFSDGVAYAWNNADLVSAIDRNGKKMFTLLPKHGRHNFHRICPFSEGYALILELNVSNRGFSPKDKAYVIDKGGNVALNFDHTTFGAFQRDREETNIFLKGELYIPEHSTGSKRDGGYTVNIKGRKVSEKLDSNFFDDVAQGAKWKFGIRIKNGFIDRQGNFLFEKPSNAIRYYNFFSEGILLYYDDGLLKGINKTGQKVLQLACDEPNFEWRPARFKDGLCAVQKKGLWGFINKEGVFVIEPQFSWVGEFFNGICPVQEKENGQCGYISKEGSFIIPPKFQTVLSFSEGLSAVKQNDKWGFIELVS